MIIKQLTHKRKTHWFTTLDSLRIIIELFWGDYFAYFWLRWLYVVPPHSQAPRTTLSKGPTPMHVGLNKNHVSQLKPRLAHIAAAKKHRRGSLLPALPHIKISTNLGAKISGSAATDSDSPPRLRLPHSTLLCIFISNFSFFRSSRRLSTLTSERTLLSRVSISA